MSFFSSIDIAASGLTAERVRMDVTSENLANAQTTNGPGVSIQTPLAGVKGPPTEFFRAAEGG